MGYTAAPTVSISTYFGVTVSAASTAEVSAGGTVTKLYVNNAGAGYTNTSVPMGILALLKVIILSPISTFSMLSKT